MKTSYLVNNETILIVANILFCKIQILVEYKSKDPNHVEWAKALKELYLPGLRDYVKSHYPLGPVWSATAKAKAAAPSAPAPPPPPPASLFTSESSSPSSSKPKVGMAAVFQEISSGKPVTSGNLIFHFLH
jgi:adenylyl cyclase-associated protein